MNVVFKEAAFKHGYAESDYFQALRNRFLRIRSRRGYDYVYEILGRNDAGDYLIILTRVGFVYGEKIIYVFHISRMCDADRRYYLRMIEP